MPNPYLPSLEYIPDGEPRVFGDRVYVYGSHDRVDCERDSTILKTKVKHITGKHAVYLIAKSHYQGWSACYFENRQLFDLVAFQFCK